MQMLTGNIPLPLVSVVIPTYNSAQLVGEALKSVIHQTYSHHEIIVVDDGSTDNTKDVLRLFGDRIQYIHQENLGPSAARNAGIRAAEGEYICFLDADDLWLPTKLEVQVSFMERREDIGLVFSDHEEFDSTGVVLESFLAAKSFYSEIISSEPIKDAFIKLAMENFISTPTVMVRSQCFKKTGLFDETLKSVEDRDLWFRMSAYFQIACLPVVLCRRRLHGFNISSDQEQSMTGRIKTLEKNLRAFPKLASPEVWHRQLADFYCSLCYIRLAQNHRTKATKAGFKSLMHGVRHVIAGGPSNASPWMFAIGSIPATLLGAKLSKSLWRTKKLFWSKRREQIP
jgi:glycosyltransferase involved in cell wall biosynthesis